MDLCCTNYSAEYLISINSNPPENITSDPCFCLAVYGPGTADIVGPGVSARSDPVGLAANGTNSGGIGNSFLYHSARSCRAILGVSIHQLHHSPARPTRSPSRYLDAQLLAHSQIPRSLRVEPTRLLLYALPSWFCPTDSETTGASWRLRERPHPSVRCGDGACNCLVDDIISPRRGSG